MKNIFRGGSNSGFIGKSRNFVKTRSAKIVMPSALAALLIVSVFVMRTQAGPNGLVASYNFDLGSGTTLSDISGTGNTGTITGPTWDNGGKNGKALLFDGVNDYVNIPDSNSLDLTNGMTMEAWVKPTASGGGSWRTVAFKQNSNNVAYALYSNQNSNRPVGQVNIGGEKNAVGTSQLANNTWTHLTTTYDGASLKLFVNGVQVSSIAVSGNIPVSTNVLRLGGNAVWGEWYKGYIDDVRIYNRALSQTEIQTDMNTAVAPPVTDTTPPSTPTNLTMTAQTEDSISISWTASTDNVGVTGYGVYKNFFINTTVTGTTATITGLSCGTSYNIGVDAFDGAGNRSSQATLTTIPVACDTTPPTVSITSPVGGTTVNGAVNVSANAADNKAVVGVQFKLDGANLGAEDTTAPYTVSWDTTAGTNGNHVLTAIARDSSNNQTTASTITVNVFNQTPNFVNDTLIIGLSEPTDMTFTPDGHMMIAERGGKVLIAEPGAQEVEATPVITLPQVWTADERGLLGIALDPNYTANGYMYLFYTNSSTSKNEVSRFTVINEVANLSSKVVIWQNDFNANIWHQGGDIQFGPDGKLYISVGDHLSSTTSQSLSSFNGKILRVNPDGTVPTDNPFYDGTGPNKDAIWLRGLRNPFRFSIDPVTSKMFIGDVGEGTWEEVNVGVRGANYGWPTCEGNCSVSGMTNPIYAYGHTATGGGSHDASITGGFVYRGTQFPAEYQGNYFFGDYAMNWIKRMTFDANGNMTGVNGFVPANGAQDGPYGDIVAMTIGPDGSVYYVDMGPFATPDAGSIRRIKNVNANQPPTSQISASPTGGPAPLTVNFSSTGSADPEGQPITYAWDFGDGTSSNQANPSHVYDTNGRYTVRLTTSDGTNSTPSNTVTITVGNAPQPSIATPANGIKFVAGQTINFSGSAADPEDGTLGSANLSWKVVFHHASHIHPFIDQIDGSSGSFQIPTSGHAYGDDTSYEIVLTATDSDGIQSQASVYVYPDIVNLTFNSQPAGLAVKVDGIPQNTPFTYETLKGFNHTISVDSPQFIGSSTYVFASWSDGGAQSHSITAPNADSSYSVTFNQTSSAPAGLVAAYNFNEGIGGSIYDVTGNNNIGSINGPIWTGAGKTGTALQFDGANDIVTVADSNSLDLTSGMTLEAWVNPSSLSTNWRTVLFKTQSGGQVYALYANQDTSRPIGQINIGGERNAVGTSQLPLNAWTHLTATYDASNLKLYVNGNLVATTPVGGSIPASTGTLTLGGNTIWGEWFQGMIDDVRIYNRALTQAEIQNDMNIPVN